MASSSLTKVITRRKLKLLSSYNSQGKDLYSGIITNGRHIDVKILGKFYDYPSVAKKNVRKALKDRIETTSLQEDKVAVFLGDTARGTVCELFGISLSGEPDFTTEFDYRFNDKILSAVMKQPSPAHAILVDEVGCSTFMLHSDAIDEVRTVQFRTNRAEDKKTLFEKEVTFLKDKCKSKTILIGLHKNMKFIKEASEAIKRYERVITQRITEANLLNLESILISSYTDWKEFDIVLELKTLSDVFSALDYKITSGIEESLEALQHRRLSVLLVHSSLQAHVLVPPDDENGWAIEANVEGVHQERVGQVDIFEWLKRNESRFECQIVIICSDLSQGHRLQRVGGMAGCSAIISTGILKPSIK